MSKSKRSGKKRPREEEEVIEEANPSPIAAESTRGTPSSIDAQTSQITLSLVVKWTAQVQDEENRPGSHEISRSKVKTTRLNLSSMNDISKLDGLSRGLLDRAFPIDDAIAPRPDYLLSDTFLRFTPDESCLSFPMDVASTEFKLVASHAGWEYVVYQSPLFNRDQDQDLPTLGPERPMFVTSIEFESVAVVLGNLGIRVSLVAYPIVAVSREWLSDVKKKIVTDPGFKGILTSLN